LNVNATLLEEGLNWSEKAEAAPGCPVVEKRDALEFDILKGIWGRDVWKDGTLVDR
jgi:hypothetical protein